MRGQHFCWGDIDFISKSAGRHGSSVGAVGCIHHDPLEHQRILTMN